MVPGSVKSEPNEWVKDKQCYEDYNRGSINSRDVIGPLEGLYV